jgi:hypothetical protein
MRHKERSHWWREKQREKQSEYTGVPHVESDLAMRSGVKAQHMDIEADVGHPLERQKFLDEP